MLKIAHIIGGLGVGGAEKMLQRLVLEHVKQPDTEVLVISMTTLGPPGHALQQAGVRVEALSMSGIFSAISGFWKLLLLLIKFRPDIVQTWLYWADLAGGLAAKLCGIKNIVWNIRCTHFGDGRWTGYVVKLNARLSCIIPRSIICCGYTALDFHRDQGFDATKMIMLPNGYDLDHFRQNRERDDQSVRPDGLHVIAIGRMDILKDYPVLVDAAKFAIDKEATLQFTIYGRGCPDHAPLNMQIAELDIGANFRLHDEVSDVRIPLSTADIFVSSSISEGFPNVVAEAMAMQIPCVVTDAGDAAIIVGDTGQVVPVSNPAALAEGIVKIARLTDAERKKLGLRARTRISENYEIGHVAGLYLSHYRNIIDAS